MDRTDTLIAQFFDEYTAEINEASTRLLQEFSRIGVRATQNVSRKPRELTVTISISEPSS